MNRKIKIIANSLLAFIVALLLVNCTSHPQSIVLNRTNSQTRTFRSNGERIYFSSTSDRGTNITYTGITSSGGMNETKKKLPNPDPHGKQPSHQQHTGHDKYAGHSPAMFKRRFFICLLLTLPVLYFAPSFQQWFNYQAIQFPGSNWVTPILSTVIYFYGGLVFLKGAYQELRSKIGMMTLVALAIFQSKDLVKHLAYSLFARHNLVLSTKNLRA